MEGDTSDERYMELETLEAIFPEIQKLSTGKLVSIRFDVPVRPVVPVTVTFPAASSTAPLPPDAAGPRVDSHQLAHLPAVTLHISLPEGYPAEKPPIFDISTNPSWLPTATARQLEQDGLRMWEDLGRNLVAYDFIDHVQQKAEKVFDMVDGENDLKIDSLHKIAILDYDIKERKAAFDKETFDCGVCIEPKKGAACHKMLDCGHVFCKSCLQDFYNNAITEGDLSVVRCLFPDCAKKRAAVPESKKRKIKTHINPSELLLMGLTQDTVARYVNLKYKNELESDKNTIYCPRAWCNGAARSKKHRKPQGLELAEASDNESDDDDEQDRDGKGEDAKKTDAKKPFDANDLLCICEDCGLAFCSRCQQSWHGEFFRCAPKRDNDEITPEEQATLDYLKLYTTPCPTCAAPVQKTHGCNHMICFRCNEHFCYLCSAWLDASNPYKHFNIQDDGKITQCYMRLFDLERGDGDHAGHFDEANAGQDIVDGWRDAPEAEGFSSDDPEDAAEVPRGNAPPPQVNEVNEAVHDDAPAVPAGPPAGAVAREAPLVLRIGGAPVPRGGRQAAPPPAPAARGRGGHHGPNPGRGARGGGNRGGAGRGGRGGRGALPVAPPQNRPRGNRAMPELQPDELDPQQEAWIRNFVRLALLDEEDDDDGDFGR